jgi:tRNA dimethylallyltransferase
MVGGSGLYVEAVVRDFRIADVPEDPVLRRRLETLPTADLVDRLETADGGLAARTDLASRRRIIRALEIAAAARRGPIETSAGPGVEIEWKVFGLDVDREVVRQRVRNRLQARLDAGLVDEVRDLLAAGLSHRRLDQLGLEYREIGAYLAGRKDRRRMVDDLAVAIGRFAKRQSTWFRGMERRGVPITWIAPGKARQILDALTRWKADG